MARKPRPPSEAASVPAIDPIATTTTEDSTAAHPAAAVAVSGAPALTPSGVAAAPLSSFMGEGDPQSKLIFVGGLDERGGVGPNGALLDKMIEAMGRKRSQVYITPVLSPADAVRCIETIVPKVIVALGKSATLPLSQVSLPGTIQLLSTPHPDEMIANPIAKKECWEQLKIAMKTLGWKK